jgi:phosphate transport system substrate-binding protein
VTLPRSFRLTRLAAIALAGAVGLAVPINQALAQTAQLDTSLTVSGSGSTFMSNFVEQCKADVKKSFNVNVTYQASGSGAGRSAYINATTDFAGSDVAFTKNELASVKNPFVYIPITIGGIAVIYKVPGVTDLRLSGPTLAKVFGGSIAKWNDDAIAKENPGAALPSETIRVIVRSDSSGTSNVFTDYLDTAGGGNWKKGVTSTFPVPAGTGVAQRGSDGVTNYVAGAQGNFAITYAESSFAEERKLSVAKVINTAGEAVAPEPDAIAEAMSDAKVQDDGTLFLNFLTTKPKAYPISTTAYLIAPQTIDAKKGDVLRTFLTHSLGACQEKADKLGYAPLPRNLVDLGLAALAKVNPGAAAVPVIGAASAPVTTAVAVTTKAVAAPTTVKKAAPTTKKKTTTKTTKKK